MKIFSLLSAAILLASSCASIVSKSSYPITINSTPSEAKITITDRKGLETYKGNTPATIKLKASSGFFSKAQYQVKFEMDGYDEKIVPIHFKVDGWYWGNLLFGGFIGFLIVDPATGAMYKIDTEFLNETLSKSTSMDTQGPDFKIYELNQIPDEWKDHLVMVEK